MVVRRWVRLSIVRISIIPGCFVVACLAMGCQAPPAIAETTRSPESAAVAPQGGVASDDPNAEAEPQETPNEFGFAPGQVAVLDWVRGPEEGRGSATVRLPDGEMLSGTWRELSSSRAGPDEDVRIRATNPSADIGDPTSMPAGATRARELIVNLTGPSGRSAHCTVPIKTGMRRTVGHGTCRSPKGERFSVRLR